MHVLYHLFINIGTTSALFNTTFLSVVEEGKEFEKMVNFFRSAKPFATLLLKLKAGLVPHKVEIEPGTVLNFWAPLEIVNGGGDKKITKPVVLLLHGFCADGLVTWIFNAPALAGDYTVFFVDLLFFGDSVTDSPDRSTSFQAECLVKGLRKFGVEKCSVVGFSYGGMVGFKMAKLYPSFVESMVITGSDMEADEPTGDKETWKKKIFSRWSHILLPDTIHGVGHLLTFGSHRFPWFPDFFVSDFLEVMFSNIKERAELLEALDFDDNDLTPVNYPQRVHLLWGANDRIQSLEVAHALKTKLGDKARLTWIEDAGHVVQMDRPFLYNSCLKQILASFYASSH